tara:strand:- start:213 stop:404 length:192 start_codon:yes stop_codon:yes gene_type:complete
MEYYEKKAIGGIIAEVTVAQVGALSKDNPGLKLRVLEKLMIGMDLEKVQMLIDKQKNWIKKKQ